MTEQNDITSETFSAPTPEIREKRPLSIVWLVPLVAIIIGGWLVYKAVTEKGPVITISFETAEGLEAGNTKVKFKNVDVGVVESITIGKDLSNVILGVEMVKGSEPYLTDKTKFWVVKARVGAGQVSGLTTLVGGAYIGVEPSTEGEKIHNFKGLEKPPVVTWDMKGKHFYLSTPRLGSLEPGSPVYFRQIKVGQVVDYKLDDDGGDVSVHIFVNSPYDQFVRENTRFWLASGLDFQLTANGLRVDTESVVSLLIGGIAFNTLSNDVIAPQAQNDNHFELYENRVEASEDKYTEKNYYYIEFTESVRGLSVGAPVEFRGMKIGSVEEIELKSDFQNLQFSIMVLVAIERERLAMPPVDNKEIERRIHVVADRGLRAHLKPGNLLTGQLFIDMEYFPDAPAAAIGSYKDLHVLPSVPSSSQKMLHDIARFVAQLNEIPIEKIGRDLGDAAEGLTMLLSNPDLQKLPGSMQRILTGVEGITTSVNSDTVSQLNSTIKDMRNLIKDVRGWVSPDSMLYGDLGETLREISSAARSINDLADLLERHPEALIQGKNMKDR